MFFDEVLGIDVSEKKPLNEIQAQIQTQPPQYAFNSSLKNGEFKTYAKLGTNGEAEKETVPFYLLLAATMVAAGFDTMVGVGTVLLGAGSGVLGSTVNPFVVSAALDALAGAELDIAIDPSIVIFVNGIAWLAVYALFCVFTMSYAKKVKADKTKTLLSEEDLANINERYGEGKGEAEETEFTGKQKLVLCVFAFAFVVMIMSVLPWWSFGITVFDGWTSVLTGYSFGDWWFGDLTAWFFWLAVIVGLIYGYTDGEFKPQRFITKTERRKRFMAWLDKMHHPETYVKTFAKLKANR